MNTKILIPATALLALALPAAAQAHVTLQPNMAAAGSFAVENVRVPNERDDAATTKVVVRLPHGFAEARYAASPGWTVKVQKGRLAKPIQTDDGPVTEEVRQITWTADSKADAIQPGQFRDFPLSVQIPGKAGDTLTFKALQTYSDGQVVRWIGAEGSDTPAPQVAVTAAASEHGASAPAAPVATKPASASVSDDDNGASKGLAIAALIAGILGVLLGGAALARRRA
jgi:uncharacterized protein YcnI